MINADQSINRWFSILPFFGVGQEFLTGKKSSCPVCGGKDRFRFDNKEGRGTFYCNQCGAGDGYRLLMLLNNWEFKQAIKEVDEVMNTNPTNTTRPPSKTNYSKNKEKLNIVWGNSTAMPMLTKENYTEYPVAEYLHDTRGIALDTINLAKGIRQHSSMTYWEGLKDCGEFCTMINRAVNLDKPSTLHVTYLQGSKKAFVSAPKKCLPRTEVPLVGSTLQLFQYNPKKGVLGITEGVENAMSVFQVTGIPTWAGINADNLLAANLPESLKVLHIFADRDKSYTGQATAYTLARKMVRQGIEVHVHLPKPTEGDWNDLLRVGKLKIKA